jgi:aryl-alcohol dehydrogenase-like predicted oxidoreductase
MQHRYVGDSGLKVSAVGLGCNNFGWRIDIEAARKVTHRAMDLGVTLFDTADMYGTPWGHSEEVLGEIIQGHRSEIVLLSKFGRRESSQELDTSRAYTLKAIEGSLKRLRTDWLDIYMVHWPDARTPTEETLRALDDIVTSGKARYIGCSNYPAWRVVEAKWTSRQAGVRGFVCSENEYSLLARDVEKELIHALEAYQMGLMPYFPLASGLLTGKYLRQGASGRLSDSALHLKSRFMTERNIEIVRNLDRFARERGRTVLELAMSWLLARPVVSAVIAGATTPEQVEQNTAAAGWVLSPEDLQQVDALTKI